MYKHDKNLHHEAKIDRRVRRAFVFIVIFVLISGLLGYLYVSRDRGGGKTLGSQGSTRTVTGAPTVRINTPLYSFEAPEAWQEIDPPRPTDKNVKSFGSLLPGEDARRLDIYEGDLPAFVGANQVVTVTTTEDDILPSARSPQCRSLQKKTASDEMRDIEWRDVTFRCEPSRGRHVLIAASIEDGMGLTFGAGNKKTTLYFVYTDHTAKENFGLFDDILSSMKVAPK